MTDKISPKMDGLQFNLIDNTLKYLGYSVHKMHLVKIYLSSELNPVALNSHFFAFVLQFVKDTY